MSSYRPMESSTGLWRRLMTFCFAGWCFSLFLAWGAAPKMAPGELIIKFRAGTTAGQLEAVERKAELRVLRRVQTPPMAQRHHNGLTLVKTGLDIGKAIAILRTDPAVEYVEPNYLFTRCSTSNDPLFTSGLLWGLYGDL